MNNAFKKVKFVKIFENEDFKNKFFDDEHLIFGIDFGTTNTVISYQLNDKINFVIENLKISEEIENSKNKNHNSFKTILKVNEILDYINEKNLNEERVKFLKNLNKLENFENIEISGFKRFIGKVNESDETNYSNNNNLNLKNYIENFFGLSVYTLSCCFFKKIKKIIYENFNIQNINAVLTVPAHFNNSARKMIRNIANESGIKIIRLINEPTAAAIAYGILQDQNEGKFLIYDFGGGTFDVSILRYHSKIFEVIGTDGNLFLGGDDIDNELLIFSGIENNRENFKKIKKIKESFSSQNNLKIGNLNNETFKNIVKKYAEKTLSIVKRLMINLEINKDDLKKIIMVGGSSQLMEIRKTLSDYFGAEKIYDGINPYEVVSIGASIFSKTMEKNSINKRILLDIIPFSIGIETAMGGAEKIIPKFSHTPIESGMYFTTFYKKQKKILINVLEGESNFANECIKIGSFELDLSDLFEKNLNNSEKLKMMQNEIKIKVTFKIDMDGILEVEAFEKNSMKKNKIVIEKFY